MILAKMKNLLSSIQHLSKKDEEVLARGTRETQGQKVLKELARMRSRMLVASTLNKQTRRL